MTDLEEVCQGNYFHSSELTQRLQRAIRLLDPKYPLVLMLAILNIHNPTIHATLRLLTTIHHPNQEALVAAGTRRGNLNNVNSSLIRLILILFVTRSTSTQTHYATLGISRGATQKDIKKAFRELAVPSLTDLCAKSNSCSTENVPPR